MGNSNEVREEEIDFDPMFSRDNRQNMRDGKAKEQENWDRRDEQGMGFNDEEGRGRRRGGKGKGKWGRREGNGQGRRGGKGEGKWGRREGNGQGRRGGKGEIKWERR